VLQGASGVGKTSLVLAGVIPNLPADEYWCIYARCSGDLEWSIKNQALRDWPATSDLPSLHEYVDEPLTQFLTRARGFIKKQIIVGVDQFEDFSSVARSTEAGFPRNASTLEGCYAPSFSTSLFHSGGLCISHG